MIQSGRMTPPNAGAVKGATDQESVTKSHRWLTAGKERGASVPQLQGTECREAKWTQKLILIRAFQKGTRPSILACET